MTQEDKKLLLKDLCARLPYRVLLMVCDSEMNEPVELLSINPKHNKPLEIDDGYDENSSTYWNLEDVKPYLRPMSSMTEEERQIQLSYRHDIMTQGFDAVEIYMSRYINWLDSRCFDWRTDGNNKTLIELGLALKAPEGIYE